MIADGNPPLHDDLDQLAALIGTWRGRGDGDYPTIEPFGYLEEVTFEHVGKPFLAYRQKTRHPDEGTPMHAEAGYVRPAGPGRAEWVVAQPTGITEICEGTFADGVLDVASTTVALSGTAKRVTATRRRYAFDGDRLVYDVWMAHGEQPVTHHLHAELTRVRD